MAFSCHLHYITVVLAKRTRHKFRFVFLFQRRLNLGSVLFEVARDVKKVVLFSLHGPWSCSQLLCLFPQRRRMSRIHSDWCMSSSTVNLPPPLDPPPTPNFHVSLQLPCFLVKLWCHRSHDLACAAMFGATCEQITPSCALWRRQFVDCCVAADAHDRRSHLRREKEKTEGFNSIGFSSDNDETDSHYCLWALWVLSLTQRSSKVIAAYCFSYYCLSHRFFITAMNRTEYICDRLLNMVCHVCHHALEVGGRVRSTTQKDLYVREDLFKLFCLSKVKYTLDSSLVYFSFFSAFSHILYVSLSLSLSFFDDGGFLFCGGCGLSEFVSVSIIPSRWAPAYKSHGGPCTLTHRPPVPVPSLLLHAHTATGKTVDQRHRKQGSRGKQKRL